MKKLNALALAIMGISSAAYASEQEGWQVELTPYIWAANVNADIMAGNQKASIDNDLWENTDAGFMGMGIISYDRFVVYLDAVYVSLSNDAKTKNGVIAPIGTTIKSDTDLNLYTGGIGWRFDTWGEHNTLDVLAGYRSASIDATLKGPTVKVGKEETVGDALLLLRPSFQISERWRFNPTLSFGVGGDSDTTYELMPQFQYQFADSFALRFGYKKLYYDYNTGTKGTANYRAFDGDFSGPFVGLGFTFPAKTKPAPAPAPIVAVPPPAKCADMDGDGVCDSTDQCPNTPPGKRVGPAGCDCDYTLTTHFAFNSAKLSPLDEVELDKLAEVLANPNLNFMTGEIEGHTDSVGKPEYNLKLSQRRADAVADYLAKKGVAMGTRMHATGMGEDHPIADNKTEDGRAENRRVVIRRTDCPAQ